MPAALRPAGSRGGLPRNGAVLIALTVLLSLFSSPAHAVQTTARTLLGTILVASESGSTSYDRDLFRHWLDGNGDCQDTRAEVLIARSTVTPTFTTSSRCTVSTGRWVSLYDGQVWTRAGDVDIDHRVALKEAWVSGARKWSQRNRDRFANDGYSKSLEVMTDNVNSSKQDSDPAEWLPPKLSTHCHYAIYWVAVKYRWRLTMDAAERNALSTLLSGSCGAKTVSVSRAI